MSGSCVEGEAFGFRFARVWGHAECCVLIKALIPADNLRNNFTGREISEALPLQLFWIKLPILANSYNHPHIESI